MGPLAGDEETAGPAGEPGDVITVEDALRLEVLRRGAPEVLAGEQSLSRPLRWVHAGEVPHLASLLRGGELVLTTGIGLSHDKGALRRFAAELGERGIAGLVIELGVSFKTVPRTLVQAAAEHELPLIALHREVPFVDVTEVINHQLLDRRAVLARQAGELKQSFTALLLDGAGIPELLGALADVIGNPVVLERVDGTLLFHAVHRRDSAEVLRRWDAVSHDLPGAVESHAVDLPTGREAQPGRLVALAVDQPLGEATAVALREAAALVALASRQLRYEEVLIARERGNLFSTLMHEDLSESEIAAQVDTLGFPRRVPHLLACLVAAAGHRDSPHGSQATIWTMVWREVRRELEQQAIPVLGGVVATSSRVVFVVGLASAKQREERAAALDALFRTALTRQLGTPEAGLLYVGASARSWTGVARALRELDQAAAAQRPRTRGWYDVTRPDLQRLLWSLRESPELRAFVERRLAPLVEHDEERGATLLATLEAYLASGGRKTDTARALHLERQSLYHRISRIESLLGTSLDDEETRLGLHLALRARGVLRRDNDDR